MGTAFGFGFWGLVHPAPPPPKKKKKKKGTDQGKDNRVTCVIPQRAFGGISATITAAFGLPLQRFGLWAYIYFALYSSFFHVIVIVVVPDASTFSFLCTCDYDIVQVRA